MDVTSGVIIDDEIIDLAFAWLCKQRKDAHHNHDVWDLRFRWEEEKPQLKRELREGTFRLSPTRMVMIDGEPMELWSSRDSLVLKAVSIVLSRAWHDVLSERCFHLAGRGGAKAAVRKVAQLVVKRQTRLAPTGLGDRAGSPCRGDTRGQLSQHDIQGQVLKPGSGDPARPQFVMKSDVKKYYASIDHDILMEQVRELIDDPVILDLVEQYIRRTVYDGGLYRDVEQGIPLGCSLSPLMGAVYLRPLDEAMQKTGLFYARFMDDWVILSPSRWKLRKAVRIVNQVLNRLKVWQHPDKTFIGRVACGFDFLGYHFRPDGLSVAEKTRQNFVSRLKQLYEQHAIPTRIDGYVRRWQRWVTSGLRQWAELMMTDSYETDDGDTNLRLRQAHNTQ